MRKIFSIGGYSYGIILPKEWAKKNYKAYIEIKEKKGNLILKPVLGEEIAH